MNKYGVNERNNRNKGITIMALVITVIVLLILATITISAISGNNIIGNSRKAKEQAEINAEMKIIGVSSNSARNLNKYGDLEERHFLDALDTNAGKGKTILKYYQKNNMYSVTFKSSGRVYQVHRNGYAKYLGILDDAIMIDADPRGSISLNKQYSVNITIKSFVHNNINKVKYVWTNSEEEPINYDDEMQLKSNGTENDKITETPIILENTTEGNYYLHVQVTKDDGEVITETFGPYAIGEAAVKLAVDPNGGTWNDSRNITEVKGKPESSIKIDDPIPQSNYEIKFKDGDNLVQTIQSNINFTKWNLDGSGVLSENNFTFKNGQAKLVAQYSVETITLPTQSKEGNSVEGYYNGDTKVGSPGDEYTPTYTKNGEETLTIKWKTNKYLVTYDYTTNGGTSCTKETDEVEYGTKVDLSKVTATKEGYTFLGWNTNKDAINAQTSDIIMTTEGVKVYAIFKKEITLSFKDASGEKHGVPHPVTIWNNNKGSATAPDITGYDGWTKETPYWTTSTEPDGTTNKIASKGTISNIENNTNYYAIYTKEITITYNLNGGTGAETPTPQKANIKVNSSNLDNIKGASINMPNVNPTKEGFEFNGWNTKADGTETHIDKDKLGEFKGDTTLYAEWTKQSYTATFDGNGGSNGTSIRKLYGEKLGELPTSTRNGYTFKGWFTSKTGGQQVTKDTTMPGRNVEYYAQWEIVSYTLTYDLNGGTLTNKPENYTIESDNFTLPEPTKEGYTFAGWTGSNGDNPQKQVTIEKGSTGDKNYIANYVDDIKPTKPTYVAKFSQGNANYTSGTWANKQVYTTITSTEKGSGVKEIQYSNDNQNTWKKLTLEKSGGIKQDGDSYYGQENWEVSNGINDTIYFRVIDESGNISEVSDPFNIKYDTAKPTITADNIEYGETLNIRLQDALSGVVAWQINESSTEPTTGWTTITSTKDTTITKTGLEVGTHYIWAKDEAGNVISKKIKVEEANNPMKVSQTAITVKTLSVTDLSTLVSDAQGTVSYTIKTNGTTSESSLNGGKLTAGAMSLDNDNDQTVVVTIKAAGNANYAEKSVDVTITVQKYTRIVEFTKPTSDKLAYNATTTAEASVTGEGGTASTAVVFTSGTTSVITCSGTNGATLKAVKGTGNSAITATLARTTTVKEAKATKTITTEKANNTMTAKNSTVYVNSETEITSFVNSNIGGALTGTIVANSDNEGGTTKGAMTTNNTKFKAGTLSATDDGNKTVKLSIKSAETENYNEKTVEVTITVKKYTRTVEFTKPTSDKLAYNSETTAEASVTGEGGTASTAVVFTSGTTSVITCSGTNGATLKAVKGTGSSVITATLAGTETVAKATATKTITAEKIANTLAVTAKTIYTGKTLNLSNQVSNAQGTVSYEIKTNGTTTASTLSGSTLTAGAMSPVNDNNQKVIITVTATGDENYESASKDLTITVRKYTRTIKFANTVPDSIKLNGTATLEVDVTGTGGTQGSITYSTSNANVIEVNGTTLTAKASSGTAVITATMARTTTVKQVTVTKEIEAGKDDNRMTVSQTELTVKTGSVTDLSTLVSNADGAVTYEIKTNGTTSESSLNGSKLTAGAMSLENDDDQTVVVTIKAAGTNDYGEKSIDVTVTVQKHTRTIAFKSTVPNEIEYNKTATAGVDVTGEGGTQGEVTYSSSNANVIAVNGTTLTAKASSGEATITATMARTTTVKQAEATKKIAGIQNKTNPMKVSQTAITVKTLSVTDLSTLVSDAQGTVSYTIKTNGTTSESSLNGGKLTAGAMSLDNDNDQTVVVTIKAAGNANYAEKSVDVTITVQKYTATITWDSTTPSSVTYGDNSKKATAKATAEGGIVGNITYKSGTTTAIKINSSTGALTVVNGNNKSSTITATLARTTTVKSGTKTTTITTTKAENTIVANDKTVKVSSTTALTSLVRDNLGGALSATKGTDNEGGEKASISNGNFIAGTLLATDDANKTVTLSITAAATDNYNEKTVTVIVTVEKYTNELTFSAPTNTTLVYGKTTTVTATPEENGGTNGEITYTSGTPSVISVSGTNLKAEKGTGSSVITANMAGTTTVKTATKTITINAAKADATNSVKITGTNKVGNKLTANVTTNSDGEKTYQWWTSDSATATSGTTISGATGDEYTLTANEKGKYVGVTAKVAAGTNWNAATDSNDITDATNNGSAMTYVTITYSKGTGVSAIGKTTENVTGSTTLPTITASAGYTKDGWYNGNTKVGEEGASYTPTTNTTLTANATPNTYTITYDYNDSALTKFDQTDEYEDTGYLIDWDKDFTITGSFRPVTKAKRYLVIGNYNSGTKTLSIEVNTSNKFRIYMGSAAVDDVSSTAIGTFNKEIPYTFSWEASTHTYTFTAFSTAANTDVSMTGTYAGATGVATNTLYVGKTDHRNNGSATFNADSYAGKLKITKKYVFGGKLNNPTPVSRLSYDWNGWHTKASGGTEVTNETNIPSADTTYYAHWSGQTYEVKFNKSAEDATGTMANQTHTYGSSLALTQNAFSRDNYTFFGWSSNSAGTGTLYTDRQSVSNLVKPSVNTEVTLYATWRSALYTVQFNGNGNTSGNTTNESLNYGTAKALTQNGYAKTGYTFANWKDGEGITYANKANVTVNSNLLNNTSSMATIGSSGQCLAGTWRTAGTGNSSDGTRSVIDVTDGPSSLITKGFQIVGNGNSLEISQDNVPVTIGNKYTMSVYAKGSGTLKISVGNSKYKSETYVLDNVSEWSRYTWTFTAGEDTASAVNNKTNFYFGNIASGKTLQICGMKVEAGETATPYVDNTNVYPLTAEWTANTYTIEYYQGNNTTTAGSTKFATTSSHTYNTAKALTTYEALGGTAPSGWTFAGWSTTQDGTEVSTVNSVLLTDGASVKNLTTTANGTVKLYAVFKRNIVFKSGANAGTTNATIEQKYNPYKTDKLTSVKSPSALTAISGWIATGTGAGYRNNSTAGAATLALNTSVTPAYNETELTYYGTYTKVINVYSGASKATNNKQTQYLNANGNKVSSISLAVPTAIDGWTVLGYRDDTTAGDKETAVTTSAVNVTPAYSTSAINYYAVYNRTLTITYAKNGGTGTVGDTTKVIYLNTNNTTTSSQEVTLSNTIYTPPTGYTFSKWTIGSTDYDKNTEFNPNLAYNAVVADWTITATAKWTANPYEITYDYNVGTYTYPTNGYMDTDYIVNWDEDFRIDSVVNIPTTGQRYLIAGNYATTSSTSKDLGLEINANNKLRVWINGAQRGVSTETVSAGTDITISFTWDASTKTYTLTSTGTNSNASVTGTYSVTGSASKTLRQGTKDHRNGAAVYKPFTTKKLSITKEHIYDTALSDLPEEATNIGYTLKGWYTTATNGTKITTSTKTPAGNTTYYAQWTRNDITITLNKDGNAYTGSGMKVTLYNGTTATSYAETISSGNTATFTAVPTGTYNIYAGKDSNHKTALVDSEVDVTATNEVSVTINYYTLTVGLSHTTVKVNDTDVSNNGTVIVLGGTTTANSNYAHTVEATANTGYSFSKWTKNSGTVTFGSTTTASTTAKVSAESKITATGVANTYTVEYYQGNNSTTAGSTKFATTSSHTYDTAKALTTYETLGGTAPSGWTFAGWSTTQDGTEVSTVNSVLLTDGASVKNLTTTANGTVKLYAVFKRNIVFKSGANAGTTNATIEQKYNPYKTDKLTSVKSPSALTAISGWIATGTGAGYRNNSTAGAATLALNTSVTPAYNETELTYYGTYTKVINVYSGASKATNNKQTQYLNANGNKVSSISLAVPTAIDGWTVLGYRDDTTAGDKETAVTTSAVNVTPAYSTSAINYYAVYNRTLTITYAKNGGTGTVGDTTKVIYLNTNNTTTSSQEVTLSNTIYTPPTGYTFSKWTIGSTDYDKNTEFNPNLAYNTANWTITATAKWTANTYTVSFNSNSGTGGQSANVTATYDSAMPTISTTAPTKTGYTFMGWYDNENYTASGAKQYYTASGASARNYDKTSNTTLYAGWKINEYTLTVNPNGGTFNGTTSNTTVKQNYDTTYNVANNPTKEGYIFTGWTLSGSGTYTYYDTSVTPTETQTFNYNSATSTTPSSYSNATNSMVEDSTATGGYSLEIITNGTSNTNAGGISLNAWPTTPLRINVLEIKAKIPTGYNINLGGIGAYYTGIGSNYRFNDKVGTGEWKTYYMAVFTGKTGNVGEKAYIYLSGTDKTQISWNINSIVMKSYTRDQFKTSYKYGAGNGTLTANWAASGSKVTFNTNNGKFDTTYVKSWSNGYYGANSTSAHRFYNYDTAYGTYPGDTQYNWTPDTRVVSRVGYSFDGWYTSATGGTKIFNSNGTLVSSLSGYSDSSGKWIKYDENITLYAHWTGISYSVKFNKNADDATGTMADQTGFVYGTAKALTANVFARTGYSFGGWSTSSSSTTVAYADKANMTTGTTIVGETVNLYAIWNENKVTVNLKNGTTAITAGYSVSLSSSSTSDTAPTGYTSNTKTNSNGTVTFTEVPNGTYYVWAGKSSGALTTRIYTGKSVTVNNDSPSAVTAQYYTLTLSKGTGIRSVSGAGTYLYNSSSVQTIAIDATVSSGYTWSTWTKTSGTNLATFTAGTKSQNVKMGAGDATLTASAIYTATPTITRSDYNTFTVSATAGSKYLISKTQTTTPTSSTTGWTTTTSKDVGTSAKETWYVWVQDANGNVSSNSATITNYKVTLTAGKGTTLTAKADTTNGADVTSGMYVLNGTPVYPTGTLSTGYNTLVVKKGSTTIENSSSQEITADTTFSTSATANVYKINFYQGNGTSTAGTTKLGDMDVTYGESVTLKSYHDDLGGTLLPKSADSATYYWTFYGWSTDQTGTTRDYTEKQSISSWNIANDINLYAVGSRGLKFYSGKDAIAPDTTKTQYWNPYSISDTYLTAIDIPTPVNTGIPSEAGWTFLGYKGGTNTANASTDIEASKVGTSYKPEYNFLAYLRSKYSRTVTIEYNANGGTGTTLATQSTQYYNSGINNNANITTPSFTLASNGFIKSGYHFVGWGETADSTTKYSAESSYTGFTPAVDSSTTKKTMYAQWESNTVTITLKLNNSAYSNSGMKVSLYQDGTEKATTTVSSGNEAIFTNVLNGTYDVYAGKHSGEKTTLLDSGVNAVINNNNDSKTINYYSMKLVAGTGISGTKQTGYTGTGTRNYLYNNDTNGTQQDISIDATVKSGYTWSTWTKTSGTNLATFTAGTKSQNVKMGAGSVTLTASATYTATPTITRSDYNTFTVSATAGSKYIISKTQTSLPTASTTGWATTTSQDVSTSAKETWYVWVQDEDGNVSPNSATITNFKVTLTAGVGTTLTAKADTTNGADVTSGMYVLNGTPVIPTGALSDGYNTLVVKKGSTTIENSSNQEITADTTFTSSATYIATPTITRSDYNTFTYTAEVGAAYYVSTSQTSAPAAGSDAASTSFALDTWITATNTGNLTLAEGTTYYVWVKDATTGGSVSANKATIAVRKVTREEGVGSTLYTGLDGTSASSKGTPVTTATKLVLAGTPFWSISIANAGFDTPVLKEGSTSRTATGYKIVVNNNVTISSGATANSYTVTYNGNGGTPSATNKQVTFNNAYGTLATSTKSGYTFAGWSYLPEGYEQLEYIESTGTQYINSGYKPSPNTGVRADYQFTSISPVQQRIYGVHGSDSTTGSFTYVYYINGSSVLAYGYKDGTGNWKSTGIAADTNRHTFKFNVEKGYWKYDSQYSVNVAESIATNTATANMFILAATANGTSVANKIGIAKLYAFDIYEDGEIVRQYVPCKKSDGTIGLYETVEGQFYQNAGTGTFTAGPTAYVTSSTIVSTPKNHTLYAKYSVSTSNKVTLTLKKDGANSTALNGYTVYISNSKTSNSKSWNGTTPSAATMNITGAMVPGTTYYVWIGKDSNHKTADADMVYSGVSFTGATTATATLNYYTLTMQTANATATVNGTSVANNEIVVVLGGTTTVGDNIEHAIVGTAATNYHFNSWSVENGNATIGDLTTASTTAKVAEASTIKVTGLANNYQNTNTSTYYETLESALSEVENNQTIKVLNSVTETTGPSVPNGKTGVKLNMNGKTTTLDNVVLTNNGTLDIYSSVNGGVLQGSAINLIKNSGTLTTNGTSNSCTLSLINTSSVAGAKVITNDANKLVTLNTNTTLTFNTAMPEDNTTNRYVIANSGTTTIQGAIIKNDLSTTSYGINNSSSGRIVMTSGAINTNGACIYSTGTGTDTPAIEISGTVSGTTITSANGYGIRNNGTGKVKVAGGKITAKTYAIYHTNTTGIVEISGGEISGNSYTIYNYYTGTVNISGGTITSVTNVIRNRQDGTINVSGGTVTSTGASAIYNGATGHINVTGGTVSGGTYGIYGLEGEVNVSGSSTSITGVTYGVAVKTGTATITGGTIEVTEGVGVYATSGTVTIGTNEATPNVSTTVPSITGGTYGVQVTTGDFNFYDGVIKGKYEDSTGYSLSKDPTATPPGYGVLKTTSGSVETAVLAKQYIVEYYQGNNSTTAGATLLTSSTHLYGQAKTLTAYSGTAPSGWEFAGWSANNGTTATTVTYTNEQSVSNLTSTPRGTIKLYAIFKRTIKFNSGVNCATTSTEEQRYNPYKTTESITAVSAPAPSTTTLSNYGWGALGYRSNKSAANRTYAVTTSAANITPAYNVADVTDATSTTVNLYAVYSRHATFYSGVEKETTSTTETPQYYNTSGNTVSNISAPAPTAISGWTARGYRADTDAKDKSYTVTTSATNIKPAYNVGNTTDKKLYLYAVYQRTLTITYNGNGSDGGSTANTTKTVYLNTNSTTTSDQAVTLATNGFTRTGYRFVEWNTQANGNGTSYAEGASYTAGLAYNASTFGKTIYAKWEANTITLTLKVDNGAYSNSGIKVDLYQSGESKASTTVSSGSTATFTAVANGTYDVYAGQHSGAKTTLIDTGLNITINDNDKTGTINYYSLKLVKGTGISGTNQTGYTNTNARNYLYKSSGTQQDISIDATVSSGYTWATWTKTAGTNLATFTPGTKSQNVKMGAGAATLTASAVQTPQITLSDFNTFTYTAEGATAYYVSTSDTAPTAGTTNASSTFALDTWTTATSTGDLTLSAGQIYYVWAESAVTGGVVSASSSIAVRTVTRSQGTGSTLTIKYTNSSGSNVTFSSNKANMLNGTILYVSAVAKTGYENPALKKDGTNVTNSTTYTIDANVTFASSATEKTAILTYNANGHGTAPANVTMKYTKATNAADALTLDGYEFQGWNTEADGTGTAYEPGAQVKAANVVPTATTLYAQWRKIRVMFKPGTEVKAKMQSLSNGNNIRYIVRASSIPSEYQKNSNIVSTSDSEIPIYMWYNNNTIYYYSEASHPQLNPDSHNMFSLMSSLESVEFDTIDTSEVTNMSGMFMLTRVTNPNFSNFDTSKVTDMSGMFTGITSTTSLDLSSFDTSNVTDMSWMFNDALHVTSINVSSFDTSNVTNMAGMFRYCYELTSLDLSNFDTSNVTDMSEMFNMSSLGAPEGTSYSTQLTSLDISNFNTSKVTDMSKMFRECCNLTSLDVSHFNTSNVTDMSYMFDGCSSITSLDVSDFNTSKVTDMSNMFDGCRLVTSLNVSNFNTLNVTNMDRMFYSCSGLTSLDLSNFDTSNVTNMTHMFGLCRNLTSLNISNFDTSNVTDMEYMFALCDSLTSLDLSSFDTSKVTNMSEMFYRCSKLVTIYVSNSWTTRAVTESTDIFDRDTKLVGGAGTTYNGDGILYARIDGGTSSPGYFTYKAASTTNLVNPTSLNNVRLTNNTSSLTSTYGSELGRQLKIKND